MSRGQGRVYLPRGSGVFWYDFSVDGKRYQASTGVKVKRDAQAVLTEERAKTLKGQPPAMNGRKVTLHELRQIAERQYELDGRRSLDRYKRAWGHLERLLGAETKATSLTPVRRDAYAQDRLTSGASRATVNYELGALRRGEKLAVEKGMLAAAAIYKLPKVLNARRGFFSDGDLAALLMVLPDYLRPVVRFAVATGWRVASEVLPLTWDQVDWEGRVVRLWAGTTKSGEPRIFPFGLAPEIEQMMTELWQGRNGRHVFHRSGEQIIDFSTAWETACKRAGLAGRLVHDLRRTMARNYRRRGVPENVIMDIGGWRTRDIFSRYDIRCESDLAEAIASVFNGKVMGKFDPPSGAGVGVSLAESR